LQFIQYQPRKVFGRFADGLSTRRRRGDDNPIYHCDACSAKGVGVCIFFSNSKNVFSIVFNLDIVW